MKKERKRKGRTNSVVSESKSERGERIVAVVQGNLLVEEVVLLVGLLVVETGDSVQDNLLVVLGNLLAEEVVLLVALLVMETVLLVVLGNLLVEDTDLLGVVDSLACYHL